MNRYTIFLNWENQYCDKDYNTQNNQQIQCNSYQITNIFLAELEQIISQFLWKCKDPKSPMQSWEGKWIGGIKLPDFRLYYKATVIETVCHWHKSKNIGQWNKIESLTNKPKHLWVLTKEARMEKDSLFTQKRDRYM